MTVRAWTLRRTGAHRAVVAALAAVIAVTAFLLAAIAGYNERAQTVGIRDYLAAMDAAAGSLQIQSRLADDPAAQQHAAERLFAGALGNLPLTVYRTVTAPPVGVAAVGGAAVAGGSVGGASGGAGTPETGPEAGQTVRLADFDDLAGHARLVAGSWPDLSAPADETWPGALDAAAAKALGVTVGDTVTLVGWQPLTVLVQAIWEPATDDDPYFTADAGRSAAELAADRAAVGFLVLSSDGIRASGASPVVSWTVVPRPAEISAADLPALSKALDALPAAVLAARAVAPSGAVSGGDLPGTLDVIIASTVAASAVGAIPALTITAISIVMLIQLARLLALQRQAETALVRSRGASVGRLMRISLGEAALISLPATALAIGGALAVGRLLHTAIPAAGWVVSAAFGIIAVAIIVLPAAHQARLPANRQLIDDSGRGRRAAATGMVLLLCGVAAVALWRFDRAGSAVVIGEDSAVHLDPIAVIAPPAVLVAAAVIAWVVLGLVAGFGQWLTRHRRGLGPWLISRQIARRTAVFGVIVVMVAIAFGGVGMAAVYSPTQRAAQQQANILRNGAPLRVQVKAGDPDQPRGYSPPAASRVAEVLGADRVFSALQQQVSVGKVAVLLTGIPLGDSAGGDGEGGAAGSPPAAGSPTPSASPVAAASGLIPGPTPSQQLAHATAGLALPDGTTSLSIDLSIALAWHRPGPMTSHSDGPPTQGPAKPGPSGQMATPTATLWIQDRNGAVTPVAVSGLPDLPLAPLAPGVAVPAAVTVELPQLLPGSRIAAFDIAPPNLPYPVDIDFRVTALTATGIGSAPIDLDPAAATWTAAPQPRVVNEEISQLLDYRLTAQAMGLSGSVPGGQVTPARITAGTAEPLPVAINPALADRLDLAVGDTVDIAIDAARQVPARIAALCPLLPGVADRPAMLADLATLEQALLAGAGFLPAPNQIWAVPKDPAAAAAALAPVLPPNSVVTTADTLSIGALADPAAITLWVGAIGAVALATVGLGSVIASLSRSRRSEAIVLRASGIGAARHSRLRGAELWLTVGVAWLLGAAVAAAGVLLTARALAGSAVVGLNGAKPALQIDGRIAAAVVGAHIVIVATMILVHSRRLRRTAERAIPSELVM